MSMGCMISHASHVANADTKFKCNVISPLDKRCGSQKHRELLALSENLVLCGAAVMVKSMSRIRQRNRWRGIYRFRSVPSLLVNNRQ